MGHFSNPANNLIGHDTDLSAYLHLYPCLEAVDFR
jgi:hypothetical protein